MIDKSIIPKPDPKRKKERFHSFSAKEFEACLSRLIGEDEEVLIAFGKE